MTGHQTRAVFERYNIVSPSDLRDAARRLDTYTSAAISSPRFGSLAHAPGNSVRPVMPCGRLTSLLNGVGDG